MLRRALDESFPDDVRRRITALTVARTTANACFRFAPPFLATIAHGNGTDLAGIGIDCMQGYYFGAPSVTPPWKLPATARTA